MKNVTKRAAHVLLALAMVLAIIPFMSKSVDAASTTTINLPADPGSTNFSINANETYSVVQNGSWISVTRTSATNLRVSYTNNLGNMSRIAYLYIKKNGTTVKTYKLVQAPAYIKATLTGSYKSGNYMVYMYYVQSNAPGQIFANSSQPGIVDPYIVGSSLTVKVDTRYPQYVNGSTVTLRNYNYNLSYKINVPKI